MVRAAIDNKLKRMPRTVRVGIVPGGLSEFITIQAAINWCATQAVPAPSAAAPYTVEIWPGIYDEQVTLAANVHVRGLGPKGSVIIYQLDATPIILNAGIREVENITVRLGVPSAARALISDGGAAAGCKFTNVDYEVTTPAAFAITVFDITGLSTIITERCSHDIAGTGASATFRLATAVSTIHIRSNDFEFTNANAFHIISTIASTVTGGGNRWAGTCGMFSVTLGAITLDGDTVVCPVLNVITGGAVVFRDNESVMGPVLPGMLIQHAVNALPATGGKVILGEGTLTADAAQIARAIDNVTIVGQGLNTRLELDGVTPVISAGVQDGWILADFDVDAGLVEIQFATNSTLHNITINGLHGTITNPDLGQTNFPGQPVIRLEEIRPLDPAATEIIKDYSRKEYQTYDPVFANPYAIMRYLERQGRVVPVPLYDWMDGSTGGTAVADTLRMILNTTAVAARDGLAHTVAAFLNSYFGAGAYDRVDWDNKIIIAFDVARTLGTEATGRGRVQLKQVNTEGILAALGIGIEIQNYALWGETFGAARSTVDLALTMTINYAYRIRVELFPGGRCDFYINDILRGSIITVANLPSGLAGATSYLVASMDNAAAAVDLSLAVSPILIWNHL